MKIVGFDALAATLDLDPTNCLALADACGHPLAADAPIGSLRDSDVPERAMLADTRRVWGAHDHAAHRDDHPRPARP